MRRFKPFTIVVSAGPDEKIVRYGRQNAIHLRCIPKALRAILCEVGLYRVQRVADGGTPISVSPHDDVRYRARYDETLAPLCDALCRAIGYAAKKPETIRVSIRRKTLTRPGRPRERRG